MSKVACQIGKMCLAVSPKVQCSVQPSVVFIDDMPHVITSLSRMFADDAKVFKQIETSADTETPQKDHDHLTDWSLKWQMYFNVNKCKRLHIGPTNPHNNYTIAGIDLDVSDQERDLGIRVYNILKFHIQSAHIVNKGVSILGIIKKSIEKLGQAHSSNTV